MSIGQTSVDQGNFSGYLYPFINETPLANFILDCYLSFYNLYPSNFPFTLEITDVNDPHFRVIIYDSLSNVVETFITDPTQTTNPPVIVNWGTQRQIYEWKVNPKDMVFRLVVVPSQLTSGVGTLSTRVLNKLPQRVRSIKVGNQTFSGHIVLEAGNNVLLKTDDPILGSVATNFLSDNLPKIRNNNKISILGLPGAGAGFYSNCNDPASLVIKTINKISPDKNGNFFIEVDGCIKAQPETTVVPGTETNPVPDFDITPGKLNIYNDCGVCCKCEYYVRVYKALKRVWSKWKDLGQLAEQLRDETVQTIQSWLQIQNCLNSNALYFKLEREPACNFLELATWCNTSSCCLNNLELRFTHILYRNGSPLSTPPAPVQVINSLIYKPGTGSYENYSPTFYNSSQKWPVAIYYYEQVGIGLSIGAILRLKVNCQSNDVLKVYLTVHCDVPDPAMCGLQNPPLPSELTAIWSNLGVPVKTVRAISEKTIPLNP